MEQQMTARARLALTVLLVLATLVLSETMEKEVDMDIRLPKHVRPYHYNLQITTSVCESDPTFTFHGLIDIEIEVSEPTDVIVLHSSGLNISTEATRFTKADTRQKEEKTKARRRQKAIPILSQDFYNEQELLVVQLSWTIEANTAWVLHIKFDGVLTQDLSGFYRSEYVDEVDGVKKWMGVTQFESIYARKAFPCFDEPEFKATFKIKLGRPKECTAISNMPIVSSRYIPGHPDWVMDEFDVTKKMSTYLVAWVISDFKCITAWNGGKIGVCARQSALEHTEFALEMGPVTLTFYEQYFDVNYPLPKLDNVAIPDFNMAAMENWGLITYKESYLLYDENSSTLKAKHAVASVVAHELAHQWFGNLVTMNWWSDLWLNEGFATFVAALGVENAFPEWNSREAEATEDFLQVYSLDALTTSHPVSANITHPREISQIFDAISYKKGSLILRMASLFLGENVFRQGVTNYLKKYQYRNADKEDLYNELTNEARRHSALREDLTVQKIFDTWTLMTGYPVVTVRREGRNLFLTQKRFVFYRTSRVRASAKNSCWYIPITYTTQSSRDFSRTAPTSWMSCVDNEHVLTNAVSDNEWYILNIQAAGIFRVKYDLENWMMLSRTLNSRHYKSIAVMNRMQIVNDVLDFAWASDVEPEIAFRVVSYLRRETEYLPWRVAFNQFEKINMIFMRTDNYGSFTRWLRRLLRPSFERIGSPRPDDYHGSLHQQRLYEWACTVQLDVCLYQARMLFAQWMRTGDSSDAQIIPINLRSNTICIAVKYGGEKEWDFAWHYYLASNASVKVEVLLSLTCSAQPWILRRFLNWVLEERGIRKQDSPSIFMGMVVSEVGYFVLKDFFMNNIEKLHELYGPKSNYYSKIINALAQRMFTSAEYEEFSDFVGANRRILEGADMAIRQAKETIKNNMRWYKYNYPKYVAQFDLIKNMKVSGRDHEL